MGAPHNPKRYGETWDPREIRVMQGELEAVRDLIVLSGGWAWHFLSPPHEELKHAAGRWAGSAWSAGGAASSGPRPSCWKAWAFRWRPPWRTRASTTRHARRRTGTP